ncbi:hypothetical protein P8935_16205 [Telmatobacter sp. DSM 110680]|uniref:Uncharacterized protein n=1 Tax=Telmatobacter sp. DSM 110680 TaxID=3036704 RepID=A0AAU7DFE8_9BACT
MRAITTVFLTHTLSAILDHIEETPGLDPDLPGLLEFKETLTQRILQLRNEDLPGFSDPHTRAA